MAEYLTVSSGGKKERTASMRVDFPAALVLWMMTARGLGNFLLTQAK